jgi:hypothetical protein
MEIMVEDLYRLKGYMSSRQCILTHIIIVQNETILSKVGMPYTKPGSHKFYESSNWRNCKLGEV